MKKIFLILILASLPITVAAKEKFVVLSSENVLKITGTCTIDVRVILTPVGESKKALYSSGTPCQDREFTFSDDLMKWSLPEGQYTLWVNGDPVKKRVVVKNVIVEPAEEKPVPIEILSPKNTFEKSLSDFGNNLKQASVSLGIMEENLSASDYAGDTVKRTLIGFLRTTLDTLAQFFGDFTEETEKIRPSEIAIPPEDSPVAAEDNPPSSLPISEEVSPEPSQEGTGAGAL